MRKGQLQEMLDSLPDEFDAEDLMYLLYVQEKVNKAEIAFKEGRVITHEELVRRSREWRG